MMRDNSQNFDVRETGSDSVYLCSYYLIQLIGLLSEPIPGTETPMDYSIMRAEISHRISSSAITRVR